MEKRDAVFLLLVLGGGGYAAYANWDAISAKLGLAELDPARIKAIDLAKESFTFRRGISNWQHLHSRQARGEILMAGDPWTAEPVAGQQYRVLVRWQREGEDVTHSFLVDIATRETVHEGLVESSPSPR